VYHYLGRNGDIWYSKASTIKQIICRDLKRKIEQVLIEILLGTYLLAS
jgi:hypothetical protein